MPSSFFSFLSTHESDHPKIIRDVSRHPDRYVHVFYLTRHAFSMKWEISEIVVAEHFDRVPVYINQSEKKRKQIWMNFMILCIGLGKGNNSLNVTLIPSCFL